MRDVLIIGGGPAGIAAAETLLSLDKKITILDSGQFSGGVPLELSCKGHIECTRCHVCMPRDATARIQRSRNLEIFSGVTIQSAAVSDAGVEVSIRRAPRYVNVRKCIDCGKCVVACPVSGAITPPPHGALPKVPFIDRDLCAHFTSKRCNACAEVCPTGAINYRERSKNSKIDARSTIVATGLVPIDPSGVQHYGYGHMPNVITTLDAERIISKYGELRRPSDGKIPRKLAIVQCAGSRTTKGGVEYCSKFCCKYGLRIGRAMVERDPEAQIEFMYMDLRTFEPRKEALRWIDKKKKNFLVSQGVASIIQPAGDGGITIRRTGPGDVSIEENEYDMAILSIGGEPRPETKLIATMLSIETDSHGFISRFDPDRGIFAAGSCRAPMDIEESFSDGQAAAIAATQYLGVKR